MAVVKMIKIKSSLPAAIRYITRDAKTDGGRLVDNSWDPGQAGAQALADGMLDQLEHGGNAPREGSVLGYHIIQSFSPDDPVDADRAHRIGIEFMERIAPGQRYVIATHVDRAHIHNHIILCPEKPDGRHMRLTKRSIQEWRDVSDDLCRREGLSVIREGIATRYGRSMADIYTTARGVSVKSAMRQAIDIAAQNARDFDTFRQLLADAGVNVAVRGTHLTYTDQASGMKVRDGKLGPAYGMDVIMARLGERAVSQISFDVSQIKSQDGNAAVVWVPGTHRRETITVPLRCVIKDGKTWRAWLPANEPVTVTDARGRYLRTTDIRGLYEHFTPPHANLAERAERATRTTPVAGLTEEERARWIRQARQLDRLNDSIQRLDAVIRRTGNGAVSLADAIDDLERDITKARAGLAAQIVARDERIAAGETAADPEDMDEIQSRQRDIQAMQNDLWELQSFRRQYERRRNAPAAPATTTRASSTRRKAWVPVAPAGTEDAFARVNARTDEQAQRRGTTAGARAAATPPNVVRPQPQQEQENTRKTQKRKGWHR